MSHITIHSNVINMNLYHLPDHSLIVAFTFAQSPLLTELDDSLSHHDLQVQIVQGFPN